MSQYIPLHEAIRPRGDRDQAGAQGERMHALADVLEAQKEPLLVSENTDTKVLADVLRTIRFPMEFQALQQEVIACFEAFDSTAMVTLGEFMTQSRQS